MYVCMLYGEREKRALEALLVSFPTVRSQKPTTGILVSASKQKRKAHSRIPYTQCALVGTRLGTPPPPPPPPANFQS